MVTILEKTWVNLHITHKAVVSFPCVKSSLRKSVSIHEATSLLFIYLKDLNSWIIKFYKYNNLIYDFEIKAGKIK